MRVPHGQILKVSAGPKSRFGSVNFDAFENVVLQMRAENRELGIVLNLKPDVNFDAFTDATDVHVFARGKLRDVEAGTHTAFVIEAKVSQRVFCGRCIGGFTQRAQRGWILAATLARSRTSASHSKLTSYLYCLRTVSLI